MRLSYGPESDHKLERPSDVVWTYSIYEFPATVLGSISSENVKFSSKKSSMGLESKCHQKKHRVCFRLPGPIETK
ncbi:hypothetical protein FHG87_005347 [Trinorchestia longiramus]|nr:hypothetical protein FHG87_005347 [Trinorchestia longiramus]